MHVLGCKDATFLILLHSDCNEWSDLRVPCWGTTYETKASSYYHLWACAATLVWCCLTASSQYLLSVIDPVTFGFRACVCAMWEAVRLLSANLVLCSINGPALSTLGTSSIASQQQRPYTQRQGVDCAVQLVGGGDAFQSHLHNKTLSGSAADMKRVH